MKYAMFLRGINVGGIRVPMAALRECLAELGLENIETYLQSGNVVFESNREVDELKPVIEKAVGGRFNYTAFVFIYPLSDLNEVINHYPFVTSEQFHRYAIFCENQTVIDDLMSVRNALDTAVEDISPGTNVVYWRVPKGQSTETPFSKLLAKPKYKSTTTNRNLNTLVKMVLN